MPAPQLQHLPFTSVWKMRIDHPYSLFVRDGAHFWSCGQCPLNATGDVLAPHDLLAQTALLTGFIDEFLGRIGVLERRGAVALLVVYYVRSADGDGEAERLGELLRGWCGEGVLVVPVSVPHFYYEGMMVEVDVYGAVGEKVVRSVVDEVTGVALQVVDAGELGWASLRVPDESQLEGVVERLLGADGITDRIIQEQWFVASDTVGKRLQALRGDRLSIRCEVVGIQHDGFAVLGQFTFTKRPVSRTILSPREHGIQNVKVSLSQSGTFFEVMGACIEAIGPVEETRRIMQAIDWTLRKHSLSFKDVRKSTTHYIAGSSADELHDNMSVRNAYYAKPGPGSTGLPVRSFPLTKSRVSVRVFGKSLTDRPSDE